MQKYQKGDRQNRQYREEVEDEIWYEFYTYCDGVTVSVLKGRMLKAAMEDIDNKTAQQIGPEMFYTAPMACTEQTGHGYILVPSATDEEEIKRRVAEAVS